MKINLYASPVFVFKRSIDFWIEIRADSSKNDSSHLKFKFYVNIGTSSEQLNSKQSGSLGNRFVNSDVLLEIIVSGFNY